MLQLASLQLSPAPNSEFVGIQPHRPLYQLVQIEKLIIFVVRILIGLFLANHISAF